MDANSPTSPRRLTAAERKNKAVRMRQAGASYEAIGKKLGVSRQAAWRMVDRALTRTERDTSELAERVRQIELLRLDRLLSSIWPAAMKGSYLAHDRVYKNMERRARYLGLDAIDESANEAQWQEIAARLGLDPVEVKSELARLRAARAAQSDPQKAVKPEEPDDGE